MLPNIEHAGCCQNMRVLLNDMRDWAEKVRS